jgi:polyhydroxybutyrate depolymerase
MTVRALASLLLVALVALALASPADAKLGKRERATLETLGTTVETLDVGNVPRRYRLHLPPGAATGQVLPVVLSFHGRGSNAAEQESVSGFSTLADREGFIAVYPEGKNARWRVFGEVDDDVRFVRALIDALVARHQADKRRVFATGISNGAQMAWRLGCDAPNAIAGLGLVAGGYTDACVQGRAHHAAAILFHGTADRLLPYGGRDGQMGVREFARAWAARPGCAPPPVGQVVYRQGDASAERWVCDAAAPVELYTLEDKGHSWPGSTMPPRLTSQDVNASQAMWEFFRALAR